MEATKGWYNTKYESWMPWIEDQYLSWFGKNKTSYIAEDNLAQTKITGNKDIDSIQDGVNSNVTGQFEKGGLLEGVGKVTSDQVFTRSERGGKGDGGGVL